MKTAIELFSSSDLYVTDCDGCGNVAVVTQLDGGGKFCHSCLHPAPKLPETPAELHAAFPWLEVRLAK